MDHHVMILYANFIIIKGSIFQEISDSKYTYVKKQSCKIHKGWWVEEKKNIEMHSFSWHFKTPLDKTNRHKNKKNIK